MIDLKKKWLILFLGRKTNSLAKSILDSIKGIQFKFSDEQAALSSYLNLGEISFIQLCRRSLF
jgi:hypothetical protein